MAVATRTYPELDGMRAIASIAIVATHTAFWAAIYDDGVLGAMTHRLELGVAIFFVLSGFLLGRPWVARALTDAPTEPVRRYYRKRIFRILPVYLVAVIAALSLIDINRGADGPTWLLNLTLTAHFAEPDLPEGLTQMWSLTVEACYYLVLPALGWLLVRVSGRRPGRLLGALAVLMATSVAWLVVWRSASGRAAETAAEQLPAYLTWFAAGIALAVFVVADTHPVSRLARTLADERLTCWIGAAAILLLVSTPLGGPAGLIPPDVSGALVRHVGYALIALLLVGPCVLAPRHDSLLAHPVMRHLGDTSYALFCCHLAVLAVLVTATPLTQFDVSWPLLFVVTFVVSQVVSEVLHVLIERPANRFGHGRSTAAAATQASATTPHH